MHPEAQHIHMCVSTYSQMHTKQYREVTSHGAAIATEVRCCGCDVCLCIVLICKLYHWNVLNCLPAGAGTLSHTGLIMAVCE